MTRVVKFTSSFVAMSMLASAASAAPRTIDPLVALSAFGTAQSAAIVCGSGTQAAATAGAAVAAQGQPGCVLPAVDAPPPVVTENVPPPVAVAPVVAGGGIGVLPLLLGLAALAGAAAILLRNNGDNDGEIVIPVSPT